MVFSFPRRLLIVLSLSKTMSNSAAEEPPHKNKKEEEETLPPSLFSSLPDAVVLSCLARASKVDHAAFSQVSTSYRSLVVSHDLYNTRCLLGCTEKYLYVCLRTPPPAPIFSRWFICRFGKTLDDADTKRPSNRLCLIPSSPSQPSESSVVALEWGIYVIGGKINGKRTSDVLLLDCRSHKWHQVPSMGVARASAAAGVVDGKIYVFGGCEDKDYRGEVFDPKTQTWDTLPIPDWSISHDWNRGSVVMEKKVYAWDKRGKGNYDSINNRCFFYYSPSEGKWGKGNYDSNRENTRCCVIDELIYCCDTLGNLLWCEGEELKWGEPNGIAWKKVKGLKDLRRSVSGSRVVHFDGDVEELSTSCMSENGISSMSNFGGNIVVFWDVVVVGLDESLKICCAEISLERREGGEIWGKIEWSEAVMTTDPLLYSSEVLHSVSVSV